MEPQRDTHATLIDLLDRVLDKGLVIHADLIVSVAGIPLIGVNLRAALAGMETMLQYGIMQAWDERTRAWEQQHRDRQEAALLQGEEAILKVPGACYATEGMFAAWRYGRFYLTPKRLCLHHGGFDEVLFEAPLDHIKGMTVHVSPDDGEGAGRLELWLELRENGVARLRTLDIDQLRQAIDNCTGTLRIPLNEEA
ncbi:MAG: gas vesicle protein GvpJ [Desulfatiglandaceae bacterium]